MTMNSPGRERRLRRIQRRSSGRIAILPLDLVVQLGPIDGAENQLPLVAMAEDTGVDAVLLRWGEARRLARDLAPETGLIVRLSASTLTDTTGAFDQLLNSVESSLAIGADAVCVDLKLGGPRELEMMQNVTRICEACERLGTICLVEAVPLAGAEAGVGPGQSIPWAARVAQELGADIIKVPNPGSVEAMREVTTQCQVPVVVAGGSQTSVADLFHAVDAALRGGAAGTAIGRNVISSVDPAGTQRAILAMVHENKPVSEVLQEIDDAVGA
jgi:2-amino-4,5-dihydroxy-6-oxo-7-(phosphooxy)heptanoate synthase